MDCQRSINLFYEPDEMETGKDSETGILFGTPGLSLLATAGTGPIRGLYTTSTGVLYAVSGSGLYSLSSTWAPTLVGTLQTTSGPVSMSDNGLAAGSLFIVDGNNGYAVTMATNAFSQVTAADWVGSNLVTFQDGYFIFAQPGTSQFYLSDLNATTFNAPATTGKNGGSDQIISIISFQRNLWLFGDRTTEVWYDAGSNQNPFQYIAGSMSMLGCAAAFSPAIINNKLFWLGKDSTGSGVVYVANGWQPQRISTHAVEIAIQKYSTISDAIGWGYEENGHQFYVLTFPTGNNTWVYDVVTGFWHERAYNNLGTLGRHRANCYAAAYGVHVVVDYANGNIYQQSLTNYSDNGTAIIRQRISPHISKDMNRIFYSRFQLDMETGVGLDGSGQGTAPQAMLSWSDDGGHSWSNEHWTPLGPIGTTRTRAIWRRLGQARNRVFKVSISDPVKVALIGAELDVMSGAE
jgi:hypothetical protein